MGNKLGRRRPAVDERFTRPQGLYEHRGIDHKKLRRLILDYKLAPCYPGSEDLALDLEECPICFLYYPSLNRSRCCTKGICTECFLQMKPQHSACTTQCPFCKTSNYAVEYRGVRTKEEKGKDQIEEQKVIEAQIRMQQQELRDEEERKQRRQELRSSSRIVTAGEIGNQELWSSSHLVQSSRYPNQENDFISSQGPSTAPTSRRYSNLGQNRDNNFDVDLEDLMVMEAIWRSIQDSGNQRNQTLYEPPWFRSVSRREASSPSSGLARAVAALAERQRQQSDASGGSGAGRATVANYPSESWIEEDNSSSTTLRGGTHVTAAAEHHLLPDNFDERMMLAMAVSLAEAQSRTSS